MTAVAIKLQIDLPIQNYRSMNKNTINLIQIQDDKY